MVFTIICFEHCLHLSVIPFADAVNWLCTLLLDCYVLLVRSVYDNCERQIGFTCFATASSTTMELLGSCCQLHSTSPRLA